MCSLVTLIDIYIFIRFIFKYIVLIVLLLCSVCSVQNSVL